MRLALGVFFVFICSTISAFETQLLLIRHGETDWNLEGRMQGHTDISLNSTGVLQSKSIAKALFEGHPDIKAIYSSKLSRAYQTACETARTFHLPVYTKSSLGEFDVGKSQGKTEVEIAELYGSNDLLVKRYPNNRERWNYSLIPDQEVVNDRIKRMNKALLEISEAHPNEKVAVFTHRGCLRAVIADIEDLDDVENLFIPNCAVVEVVYNSESKEAPFRILSVK